MNEGRIVFGAKLFKKKKKKKKNLLNVRACVRKPKSLTHAANGG